MIAFQFFVGFILAYILLRWYTKETAFILMSAIAFVPWLIVHTFTAGLLYVIPGLVMSVFTYIEFGSYTTFYITRIWVMFVIGTAIYPYLRNVVRPAWIKFAREVY